MFLARLRSIDPRIAIALILFSYLVLGFTVLGFNRSPLQALITSTSAVLLEVILARLFKRQWLVPLSALITSFSLSILLNYSHDYFVLLVPVFFAIGSKYIFTFDGRHIFNPALAGVTFSLLTASTLITAAPAYQWNGIESMSVFMAMLALIFLLPQVRRGALVATFLVTFTALTALRAWVMRWHLPFETLFLGTLSSPAFFLFTFFMITDPATSPPKRKHQIWLGVGLAVVDLLYHVKQSYFTFFYAAFTISAGRLIFLHARAAIREGVGEWFRARFVRSGHYRRIAFAGALAASGLFLHRTIVPALEIDELALRFEAIPPSRSGIDPKMGDVLVRVDPRIQHVAKWLFSVGDSVAVGDYDGDGRQDLFFTFTLKEDAHRNALYRNLGDFRFERVELPAIRDKTKHIEEHGVPSSAMFVDYDSDGDRDLFITYACGTPVMLRNRLREDGTATFEDVTASLGLDTWSNAMAANFLDIDRDGHLDLIVGNVLPERLPNYDRPVRLDLFHLPEPEHEGDERMFDFMHSSWHMSDNGGVNHVYLQKNGRFEKMDSAAFGMPETMWTLAIGTGDLDQDGFTDIYVANDFGPDDLYFNDGGRRFVNHKGRMFGSIGRDTYKGMNSSIGDVNNDGWLDVYVSNVHHALQAEGSLLWMFGPNRRIDDRATAMGALNEDRFGWGATFADFDNDGWLDIVQANGMVDDAIDRRFEECADYWYVNEKIARSPPSIHRYANKWGDIRGFCIYPNEPDRLYLNRDGSGGERRFVDVADRVGLVHRANTRGTAAVDLDDDGRIDLVITDQFGAPAIYRNATADDSSWIGFELIGDGVSCNRDAVGSTVRVRDQMREVQIVNGFSSQNDRRAHFGLGEHRDPVTVEIDWCGKQKETYGPFEPGRYHSVTWLPAKSSPASKM